MKLKCFYCENFSYYYYKHNNSGHLYALCKGDNAFFMQNLLGIQMKHYYTVITKEEFVNITNMNRALE